jgi:hypothetical protein
MPIQGLSDKVRLPRAGTIRLGIKKTKIIKRDGKDVEVEYPAEVEHFVCPKLVQKVYGSEPKALVVMFPVENEEVFFQQWYRRYGNGILLCKGDGVEAHAWDFDKGQLQKIKCPCELLEKGDCRAIGNLQFLLPEVEEAAAVWQINTGSKNSIIDLNSGIKFIRAVAGRIAMIPLLLKREEIATTRVEDKELKRGRHWTMKLSLEGTSLEKLQLMGKIKPTEIMLPAADESQPEDLFPANGFSPEEDEKKQVKARADEEKKKLKEKEAFEKAELVKAGHDLEALLKSYQDLGGKISKKQEERITELKTKTEIDKAIEYFTAKKRTLDEQLGEGIPF